MQFSKSAGLRLTDIRMESGFNVITLYGRGTKTGIFKIKPLFPNHTLNIKNCSIEIEVFKGD